MQPKTITAAPLEVAYLEYGAAAGWPCLVGHGFPYDVHAYAETASILAKAGARVIVPYLRGYGPAPSTGDPSHPVPTAAEPPHRSHHRWWCRVGSLLYLVVSS